MVRACGSRAALGGCLLAISVGATPAVAGPPAHVYTGRLGGHGFIRVDVKGNRARVYFEAPCRGAGPAAEPRILGTSEGVREPGNLSPVSGHVSAGRLSIRTTEEAEEHDEAAAGNPEVSIEVTARLTPGLATGRVSIEQSEVPGLDQDPTLSIPGCSTGTLGFSARRRGH